nr:hypothetical protein [Desulfobulbaceae bacterium]
MMKPELSDFVFMAEKSGLVPVCQEILADLDTPLTAFAKVAIDKNHAFLLESVQGGEKWGRYSFIGFDPLATFTSWGNSVEIRRNQSAALPQTGGEWTFQLIDHLADLSLGFLILLFQV